MHHLINYYINNMIWRNVVGTVLICGKNHVRDYLLKFCFRTKWFGLIHLSGRIMSVLLFYFSPFSHFIFRIIISNFEASKVIVNGSLIIFFGSNIQNPPKFSITNIIFILTMSNPRHYNVFQKLMLLLSYCHRYFHHASIIFVTKQLLLLASASHIYCHPQDIVPLPTLILWPLVWPSSYHCNCLVISATIL